MMLKIMGNITCTAHDGEQAVDACQTFRPDVILLDIGLPKMNGYETCRCLRQRFEGEKLVIIAQTGWGQEEDRYRTQQAGFDYHMIKPIDLTLLTEILAGLANGR